MGNKIYPIGIQNFESLRLDGYFYIDKTALIYQLVKSGRYYFLSRPRRFGKACLSPLWKLISKGKRNFSRTGYGKTGKGLDKISHTAH